MEPEKQESEVRHWNMINFNEWQALKQYGDLTKGFKGFVPEELDEICVFYDEDYNFLDYIERKKIEDITPAYVLLPRFFWEQHQELKGSICLDALPSLKYKERIDLLHTEEKAHWLFLQDRTLGEPLFESSIIPRKEQVEPVNFFIDSIQEHHRVRGILQAAPGVGKTTMTIDIIQRLKARSIVVVPNEVLQDQWVDAILKFTDLEKEQIGVIQGSDLKKNAEEIDKDICIVKIQSLYSQIKHNKLQELAQFYRYINAVVYDECHNSGAATSYAKTGSLFGTPNIIGLSATPYRVGLNDYLLKVAIGETVFNVEHNNLDPDIEIHKVWTEFTPAELKRLQTIGQDYILFLGMFGSMMKTKDQYFIYLADVVNWNYGQGHNIVVLFPTIALMEKLNYYIKERHPETYKKVLLLKGKTKQDSADIVKIERKKLMQEYKEFKELKDERVKSKELKRKDYNTIIKERRAEIDARIAYLKEHAIDIYKQKVQESEIIISNYNLLSAGFDKSQLSNIIFGGPPRVGKVSVIQSIGRITRKHPGKKHPLVQYFIPSLFLDLNKSTAIILQKNIKVQYMNSNITYKGF